MAADPTPKTTERKTLATSDDMVVTLRASKDGKVRLSCASWEDARVMLPGDTLELKRRKTDYLLVHKAAPK